MANNIKIYDSVSNYVYHVILYKGFPNAIQRVATKYVFSPSSKSIVVFPTYESWKRMTNRWRLKMPGKVQHYVNALLSKIHTLTHRSGCDFRWLIPRILCFFLKVFNPLLLKRVLKCMYYWRQTKNFIWNVHFSAIQICSYLESRKCVMRIIFFKLS